MPSSILAETIAWEAWEYEVLIVRSLLFRQRKDYCVAQGNEDHLRDAETPKQSTLLLDASCTENNSQCSIPGEHMEDGEIEPHYP